ncbi:hypothetical protein PC116_g28180 [Phytophthora cactorum]|nr:hypothetical protein Pcac1_g11602 [Phytophthora cactorum]KAG2877550.1 hypothetical protein PC114_g23569 [Phytophthora cactorum]KAG2974240.1 hypothetical protein PC120_g26026 [Phytophthora cactorum]KAG3188369.1 hypothetical protein C6341_g2816 [Phytophthora cactorum]KAG4223356.1 hypothetical protein PC116_g28180 [Phytophthora cactorum]
MVTHADVLSVDCTNTLCRPSRRPRWRTTESTTRRRRLQSTTRNTTTERATCSARAARWRLLTARVWCWRSWKRSSEEDADEGDQVGGGPPSGTSTAPALARLLW